MICSTRLISRLALVSDGPRSDNKRDVTGISKQTKRVNDVLTLSVLIIVRLFNTFDIIDICVLCV